MADVSEYELHGAQPSPRHRAERRRNIAPSIAWVGSAGAIALSLFTLHQAHEVEADKSETTRCNVNYLAASSLPDGDKNPSVAMRALHVPAQAISRVEWFPAMCHTGLSAGRFDEGVTGSSWQLAPGNHDKAFDNCVVYAVPNQVIAESGNRDQPAVLACLGPDTIVQI